MPDFEGEDLLVCVACGTQFDVSYDHGLSKCKICEDPRQFIPASGQAWTSLRRERGRHKNEWKQDSHDDRIWSLYADPKLGIGERAILIKTSHGNVIWDLFAYLDDDLVKFIQHQGGVKAIVISHPHFYTTHLDWAATFKCPVFIHAADSEWLSRPDPGGYRRLINSVTQEIIPGVTAIQTGGHFPGSLVLHFDKHLFIADSIMTVQAAYAPHPRPQGMNTYSFLWSIPNMIPMDPTGIERIWNAVKDFDFEATHGLMLGMDIYGTDCKQRVLDSAQIQIKRMGYSSHALLKEKL
ncbi:hypothetical protein K461DRAFT_319196 [Myriangium duriaei CBS 260.36]|uniref:Metallo-beta-lactamase domain-containing protein n=1 Tax=Myriangium duriaei CBS 260.36 TaxID=1168546 RepID=A0A9P4J749_9PEZI|nr:hypothetical protein K461DRAFT_319196 [Myriangium duriaei CBS 260.36]